MFKKITKKILLATSVAASVVLSFLFNFDNRQTADENSVSFKDPIFSIDKVYAAEGGDCSGCGCEAGNSWDAGTFDPPPPPPVVDVQWR